MKLIKLLLQTALFLMLLNIILPVYAMEKPFIQYDPYASQNVLQQAFQNSYINPKLCISSIKTYIANRAHYNSISMNKKILPSQDLDPIQLIAFCYVHLDQYSKAVKLLTPFLSDNKVSKNTIKALNTMAIYIPESERQNITNHQLYILTDHQLTAIKDAKLLNKRKLQISLQFTMVQLALSINNFKKARRSLEMIKVELEKSKYSYENTLLAFYYGLYYVSINQQQLGLSHLFYANKLADANKYIQLNSRIKTSISQLYQQKHQFSLALTFSAQNVDILMKTKNKIKQAESLINLAILKRQNKEYNTATVYLFNTLGLIKDQGNVNILAKLLFELGKNYAAMYEISHSPKALKLANKYIQNARAYFTTIGKTKSEIETLLLLSKLNIDKKEIALAILQLERLLGLAKSNYPMLRVRAYEMLASSYEVTGDHKRTIANFKKFYTLQTKIKAHFFQLQQLQISEQLHLYQEIRYHRELENENKNLKKINTAIAENVNFYQTIAAISILLIIYLLAKTYRLIRAQKTASQLLSFHRRSSLPNQYNHYNPYTTLYTGERLYYALIYVPYLSHLNLMKGLLKGKKIESRLGKLILKYFNKKAHIFHIRDNQLLFISEQELHRNATEFMLKIEQFFIMFADKYRLSGKISIGLTAFPFLQHAEKAVNSSRTIDIVSLALYGAKQLQKQSNEMSWVELSTIDKLSPAFLDGNLWSIAQQGISKGIIKVKTSHPKLCIDWPEIRVGSSCD